MKRLIALIVILLLGFYVGWPGWTGYQIANALKAKDGPTLETKISFADVRESLRPATVQKIGEIYDGFAAQYGAGAAATISSIKRDVVPTVADNALKQLVTAPNLIRLANEGGSLKESAERILREQISKIGGLPGLGGATAGVPSAPGGIQIPGGLGQLAGKIGLDPRQIPGLGGAAPKVEPALPPATGVAVNGPDSATRAAAYGLSNIKRFGLLDALAFELGVAQDAAASEPDVTVEMRFISGDWRVVGVRPRI